MKKKDIKKIIKFLKLHLCAGESYERGDVYLKIGDAETEGSGSFEWADEFWEEVEQELINSMKEK